MTFHKHLETHCWNIITIKKVWNVDKSMHEAVDICSSYRKVTAFRCIKTENALFCLPIKEVKIVKSAARTIFGQPDSIFRGWTTTKLRNWVFWKSAVSKKKSSPDPITYRRLFLTSVAEKLKLKDKTQAKNSRKKLNHNEAFTSFKKILEKNWFYQVFS